MKYVAKYELTEEVADKIVAAVTAAVHSDYYYTHHNGACSDYGMLLTTPDGDMYTSELNPGLVLNELDDFTTTIEELRNYKYSIGWMTSGGNESLIDIDDDTVTLMVIGRRHGIPPIFNFFKDQIPLEVIKYETQAPEYSWWEKGIDISEFREI